MPLVLHDTLTGKRIPFEPAKPGVARVYTCGPTTYDVAHVGHGRAALAPDILVRHLRGQGLDVVYTRNITDVDDKILKRANERGEQPMALSAAFAKQYQDDMRALGCVDPTHEPKVSETIPEIVSLIERLIASGNAYVLEMSSGAKDVYYAVRSFTQYGKLSNRKIDELEVGARIEANEQKRDPLDFALWKGCVGDAWGWDSPWGKGRPGWHIECSAMSEKYLGYGFDIHCGGMDLIFPHHENEIAQSEAAHPGEGEMSRIWIHNGFVNVDKEKMAKSLGNFVTIKQTYERNDPEALRYFLLTVHYRGPISFDTEKLASGRVVFPGVLDAETRVDYLYQAVARLGAAAKAAVEGAAAKAPKELAAFEKVADEARARVDKALDDDLNPPVALAVIGEVAKAANELCDLVAKRKKDQAIQVAAPAIAEKLRASLLAATEPLGLLRLAPEAYRARTEEPRLKVLGKTRAEIQHKLDERDAARQNKDWARGDAIRAELLAEGIEILDGAEGTSFRISAI